MLTDLEAISWGDDAPLGILLSLSIVLEYLLFMSPAVPCIFLAVAASLLGTGRPSWLVQGTAVGSGPSRWALADSGGRWQEPSGRRSHPTRLPE